MIFSWEKKKILITGHSGFVGSWLTFVLNKKNIENYGVSLKSEKSKLFRILPSNKNNFYFDINDFNKLDKLVNKIKPNIIIHLAAKSLVLKSYANPIETYKTNIMGTLNVLRVLKKYKFLKTGIFFTTDKVYQNVENKKKFKEDDSLSGDDPYSGSKAASEIVINSFVKSFLKNKNLVVLRAGNIIGGGDYTKSRLIPDIINNYLNKSKMKVRNLNSIRPWQHVIDITNIILRIIEKIYNKNKFFDSFNLGPSKSNVKVKKIIYEFEKKFNFKKAILKNNIYEKKVLKLNSNKIYKKFKLKNKLSTHDSIKRTIQWYKELHQNKKNAQTLCEGDLDYFNKI